MKVVSIYEGLVYQPSKPSISVLFESSFTKEIRIVFKKNQVMKEHKATFPIVVEIVDGIIDFGVKGEVYCLKKGNIISLEGGVPHNLKALEDSIIRLTLSKFDKPERVETVVKNS